MPRNLVLIDGTHMDWMDAVRGTAILLLLVWHASAVPTMYDVAMPEVVRSANAFFLPFRMPTLMLLSGMLLARSLRKPLPRYLAGKFSMVLWPYVAWVVIAELTFLDQPGIPWWHWHAWYATSYLWFLFFIGVYYAAAPLLMRLPAWIPIAAATLGGVLLEAGTMEQRMGYFAIFFFTGSLLASRPGLIDHLTRPGVTALLAVPAVAFGALSVAFPEPLHYAAWGAPLSIVGALALIGLFSRSSRGPVTRAMEFLGRSSIVFYVSHFPVMALLSQTPLAELGFLPLTAANLAAAALVGSALARRKNSAPVRWLFQAPDAATSRLTALLGVLLRPLTGSVPAGVSRVAPRSTATDHSGSSM